MKKRILFICQHRPDRSPSQRFRFEQYLNYLTENGYECHHVFLLSEKKDKIFYASGKHVKKVLILFTSFWILIKQSYFRKYDIVFVQREAFMLGTSYFERRFARKSKLIYDFDDSIWIHQTGTIRSNNKFFYFLKNPDKTQDIIKFSHIVFAGNNYLADYALQYNDNVKIIPTTIDTDIYRVSSNTNKNKLCIGWSGSFSTIIHFEFIINALLKVKKNYRERVYFKVIGDETFVNQELDIQGLPWIKSTEVKDLSEIDIGIMPLPNDEWTKGKCALKGLQYMALSIPCVMSPVGVNKDIIQDGVNGFLADRQEEWVEKLSKLIDSKDLREKIGKKGREKVIQSYSFESQKDRYLEYFNELIEK